MGARRRAAVAMATAAARLLDNLDSHQRRAACWPFPADEERQLWFYTPTDHGGLPLGAMTPPQQRLTHELVATGLSPAGYATVAAVMGLENILDHTEGWVVDFGRPRGRDPQLYWVAVFGEPGSAQWAWRFGGHHVSLHHTVVDGELVSVNPSFLGADPAAVPLLGPHVHRPLAAFEDLGRELVRSLDEAGRALARVSPVAPTDLVGVNRPVLHDGDRTLPLELVWRGRLEAELDARVAAMHRDAEAALGLTDAHHEALSFRTVPKGIPAARLGADSRQILSTLLSVYLQRLPDELAELEQARLDAVGLDALSFLWAGGIEPGEPHYYRVQGGHLLVEYDNTARGANHVHTVWRDLGNDFGRDALAAHYLHGAHRH